MPTAFLISDLHLTESKRDRYKWSVWEWTRNVIEKHKVDVLYILGDVLDKKDRHPSELVNDIALEIKKCAALVPVIILKGNHDYLKPDHPFFKFVTWYANVTFIDTPSRLGNSYWLPHSRNPEEEWADIDFTDDSIDYFFLHQSVIGSVVSNYHEMKTGLSTAIFKGCTAKIFSGDIHVPQDINIRGVTKPLTYVGTPYPVAFGDDYLGRGLLLDQETGETTELNMDTIQKLHVRINSLDELEKISVKENDQLKITLTLANAELHDWPVHKQEIKNMCEDAGVELCDLKLQKEPNTRLEKAQHKTGKDAYKSISKTEVLHKFAEQEKLSEDFLKIGLELIE